MPVDDPFRPRSEPSARWVRVRLGGATVADSRTPLLVVWFGPDRLPTYFFRRDEVRGDLLHDERVEGDVRLWTVRAGGHEVPGGAWAPLDPPPDLTALRDLVTFRWGRGLEWYEEDLRVAIHARDPHKRVDAVPSSRHVVISVDGVALAESRRPTLVFETHLPTRYYLPAEDVHMDRFEPSDTRTGCPYKGTAAYLSARTDRGLHRDVAWLYPDPVPEMPRIAGLVSFFNERVDIRVDGEDLARPVTPWSVPDASADEPV
jgi:uncharacterized protein (DUF427 family)